MSAESISRRSNKHHHYSEADWEAVLERARIEVVRLTRQSGSFSTDALRERLEVGSMTAVRIKDHLIQEGAVVHLGHNLGNAAPGVVRNRVTLADLVGLAEECFDPAHHPSAGRRGIMSDRGVDKISASQLKDIRAASNLIAENAGDGSAAAVGDEWFDWVEAGGDAGAGDWRLVEQVKMWSDKRHRAKFARRGKPWSPRKNSSRPKLASATRLLLDLAATRGLLGKSARHSREHAVHAAEWQPQILRWTETLMEASGRECPRAIREGCRILALHATRRGELEPGAVNWEAVRDEIDRARAEGAMKYAPFARARWAYNTLRDLGLISGPQWVTHQSRRVTLVPKSVIRESATTHDFSEWRTGSGKFARALVSGRFGIKDWVNWSTAKSDRELRAANLPPRAWPNPTPEEQRRLHRAKGSHNELFRLSPGVVRHRLGQVALTAGWAEREHQIDWSEHGLERLVDPGLVEEFAKDRAHQVRGVDSNGDFTTSVGSQVCFTLATIASPFLQARALEAGDDDLAAALKRHSDDLKALGVRFEADDRKNTWAIVEAWDAGTGRGGWPRLKDLRDRLVSRIEERAGLPLHQQAGALREDRYVPDRTWAVLVRDACVISLLRKVPVRVKALVELTTAMWINEGRGGNAAPTRPWEGGIRVEFTRSTSKSRRPFRPYLIRPQHVGVPAREEDLCRPLWELYFMSRGARDEVLTLVDRPKGSDGKEGDPVRRLCESPYVFPALARTGGGHGTRRADRIKRGLKWGTGSASDQFSRRVLESAEALGMNRDALEGLWGATSIHVIRLLFGTHWANQPGRLKEASVMLQHSNVATTEKHYCVTDESKVDLFEEDPM